MKVLVVGAGVIGSVYAGQLAEAGHEVMLLARGSRINELRRDGLRLRRSGRAGSTPPVTITGELPTAPPDLTILAVRREQAMSAAEQVGRAGAGTVMLFGNYAGSTAELGAACGAQRVVAGFPGVGGRMDSDGLTYTLIDQQPTVVGAIRGPRESALEIAADLRRAGFPTRVEPDMDGWLGTHAALVVPMAAAIKAAGGQSDALAARGDLLRLAVTATRATYRAQRRQGRLVADRSLRLLYLLMPSWFAARYWSHALRGEFGELAFAAHTRHAWDEMAALGAWLRATVDADEDAAAALDRVLEVAAERPSSPAR
jgi:2-dehydropantoate 2-reductase